MPASFCRRGRGTGATAGAQPVPGDGSPSFGSTKPRPVRDAALPEDAGFRVESVRGCRMAGAPFRRGNGHAAREIPCNPRTCFRTIADRIRISGSLTGAAARGAMSARRRNAAAGSGRKARRTAHAYRRRVAKTATGSANICSSFERSGHAKVSAGVWHSVHSEHASQNLNSQPSGGKP